MHYSKYQYFSEEIREAEEVSVEASRLLHELLEFMSKAGSQERWIEFYSQELKNTIEKCRKALSFYRSCNGWGGEGLSAEKKICKEIKRKLEREKARPWRSYSV